MVNGQREYLLTYYSQSSGKEKIAHSISVNFDDIQWTELFLIRVLQILPCQKKLASEQCTYLGCWHYSLILECGDGNAFCHGDSKDPYRFWIINYSYWWIIFWVYCANDSSFPFLGCKHFISFTPHISDVIGVIVLASSVCVWVGLLRAHYTPLQRYMGYLCTRKVQYAPPRRNMHLPGAQVPQIPL